METVKDDLINKKEVRYFNVLKALGIIAVVAGHTGRPAILATFVYLYHMALFFFISGYWYKDYYSQHPILSFWKRIKSIYISFVVIGALFLSIHNLLFRLHLYSDKVQPVIDHIYKGREYIGKLKLILTFYNTETMTGAFWFLTSLFEVNILFGLISFIIFKVFSKHQESIRFTTVIACFLYGDYLTRHQIFLQRNFNIALVAVLIFYFGYLYQKYEEYVKINIFGAISLFAVLCYSMYQGSVHMIINQYSSLAFFIIVSAAGIYINIYMAKKLIAIDSFGLLQYIGKSSLFILAFHFLSFKVVYLIQIKLYHLPITVLAKFPVLDSNHGWWILYILCGVFIPTGIKFVFDKAFLLSKRYLFRTAAILPIFNQTKGN